MPPLLQMYFLKGAGEKYFRHWGHMVSVAATQLHAGGMKAAVDSREMNDDGHVPIKLFIATVNGKDNILYVIPLTRNAQNRQIHKKYIRGCRGPGRCG